MTDEVYDALKPCVENKEPKDPVFSWKNGSPVKDFRGSWDALTKAAGMPDLLFHDFRRSAARNLIRSGVSRDVAKKITGHKTDSMFSRYDIVAEDDISDAAAKLQARREIGRKLVTEQNAKP
jgi:integrase